MAKALVREGGRLLGSNAYLSLLLPDKVSNPTKLTCEELTGPGVAEGSVHKDDVTCALGPKATPAAKGICGWSFENKKAHFCENTLEQTILNDDGPVYKGCLPGILANYVVPLVSKNDSGQELALGVLNAEAPEGVLDHDIHVPILKQLAEACVPVIKRRYREDKLWSDLRTLIPQKTAHRPGEPISVQQGCRSARLAQRDRSPQTKVC